jgi:hypothetical protein
MPFQSLLVETVFPLEAARHWNQFKEGGPTKKVAPQRTKLQHAEKIRQQQKNAGLAAVEFGRRVTMPPNTLSIPRSYNRVLTTE